MEGNGRSVNGFLIEDTNDTKAIANLIKSAIENQELRGKAQEYNVSFIQKNYSREMLQKEIIGLYQNVNLN